MAEMLQIGLDHDDMLYAHLGDIADTKAEYYINLEDIIEEYKVKYAQKNYIEVNYLDSLKKYDPEEYEETSIDDFVNGDYMYYLDPEDGTAYTPSKKSSTPSSPSSATTTSPTTAGHSGPTSSTPRSMSSTSR